MLVYYELHQNHPNIHNVNQTYIKPTYSMNMFVVINHRFIIYL